MTFLSVNLNKVALLRNSRGRNYPDLLQVAQDCIRFGADGITLHPRPDERHARRQDVRDLKDALSVALNVEGYPSEDFLRLIEETRPAQCTLVPDAPNAITSDHGWDTHAHRQFLFEMVGRIQAAGVRASLFCDPDLDMIEGAREIGADRIELYTEAFASAFSQPLTLSSNAPAASEAHILAAVEPYARAAAYAHELGLGINAGHDLNLLNLRFFLAHVPHIHEVSIGHAIVTDALYLGLEETIRQYVKEAGVRGA